MTRWFLSFLILATLMPAYSSKLENCEQITLVSPLPTNNSIYDLNWNGDQFIAVGENGTLLFSENGINWQSQTINLSFTRIKWLDNRYWASSGNTLYTSYDGRSWSAIDFKSNLSLESWVIKDFSWSGSQFMVVGTNNLMARSSNGIEWTFRYGPIEFERTVLEKVIWDGSRWVVSGAYVAASIDGRIWQTLYKSPSRIIDFHWDGSRFMGVENRTLISSSNGTSWTNVKSNVDRFFATPQRKYVVSGKELSSSTDLNRWTKEIFSGASQILTLAGSDYKDIALGVAGYLHGRADDQWVDLRVINSNLLRGRPTRFGYYLYLASGPNIISSLDGYEWRETPIFGVVNGLAGDGQRMFAVGKDGVLFESEDGATWNLILDDFTDETLNGIIHRERFVAWSNNKIWTNAGLQWLKATITLASDEVITKMEPGGEFANMFLLARKNNETRLFTSNNGSSWKLTALPDETLVDLAASDDIMVATTGSGSLYTSVQSGTWEKLGLGPKGLQEISWVGSFFISRDQTGKLFTSTDGKDWDEESQYLTAELERFVWDNGRLMTLATNGAMTLTRCTSQAREQAPHRNSQLVFPWISNSDRFKSLLVINNTGDEVAQVSLTATRSSGESRSVSRTIPARGFLKEDAGSLFAKLGKGQGYSVLAISENSDLQGSWITFNLETPSGQSPSQGIAVRLPSGDQVGSAYVGHQLLLGYLPITGGMTSGPAIVNVGSNTTDLFYTLYDKKGNRLQATPYQVKDVPPLRPQALTANLMTATSNSDLFLVVTSTRQPIAGVDFAFNHLGEAAIGNATSLDYPSAGNSLFPWISNSSVYQSLMVINNLSQQKATATLTATGPDGKSAKANISIPASSLYTANPGELFPSLGTGGFSVEMSSAQPLRGSWLTNSLRSDSGASPSQGVAVHLDDPQQVGNAVLFSFIEHSDDLTTVPVLVNLGIKRNLDVHLFDRSGKLVAKGQLPSVPTDQPTPINLDAFLPAGVTEAYLVVSVPTGGLTGSTFVFNGEWEPAIGSAIPINFVKPQ